MSHAKYPRRGNCGPQLSLSPVVSTSSAPSSFPIFFHKPTLHFFPFSSSPSPATLIPFNTTPTPRHPPSWPPPPFLPKSPPHPPSWAPLPNPSCPSPSPPRGPGYARRPPRPPGPGLGRGGRCGTAPGPSTPARGRYHARTSEQLGRLDPPASKSHSDWPSRSREGGASGGSHPLVAGAPVVPVNQPCPHRAGAPGSGPAPGAETQAPPLRRRVQGPPTGGRGAPT